MAKQVATQIFSGGKAYNIWDIEAHAGLLSVTKNINAVSSTVDAHVNDTEHHFSDEDRNKLNTVETGLETLSNTVTDHTSDNSIHVTDDERELWNTVSDKWEASDLTSAHSAFDPFATSVDSQAFAKTASANALDSAKTWANDKFVEKTTLNDYYKKTETSAKEQISVEFEKKQDLLDFQFDNDRIVGLKYNTDEGAFSGIGYTYTGDDTIDVDNINHIISLTKDFVEDATFDAFSAEQNSKNTDFQTQINNTDTKINTVSSTFNAFSAETKTHFDSVDNSISAIETALNTKANNDDFQTLSASFNTYSASVADQIAHGVAASAWIDDNHEELVFKHDIDDMATQTWVNEQHYLTEHQSLDDYYKKTETSGSTALSIAFDSISSYTKNISSYIANNEQLWRVSAGVEVTSNDGTVDITPATYPDKIVYDLHVTPGAGGGTNIIGTNGVSAAFDQTTSAWNVGLSDAGCYYYAQTDNNAIELTATDGPQNLFEAVNGEVVSTTPFWRFKSNSYADIINGYVCIPMTVDAVSLNVGVTFDWDQADNDWYNLGISMLTPDENDIIEHVFNYAPSEVCKATTNINIAWKNDTTFAKCVSAVSGSNKFPNGTLCNVFKICYCPLNHENNSQKNSKYASVSAPLNCWATANISIRENEASFNSYEPAEATDGKVNVVQGDTPDYLSSKIKTGLGLSKTTVSDDGTGQAVELGIDVADANPGQVLKYTGDNTIEWADDLAASPSVLVNKFTSSDTSISIDTYIEEGIQKVNLTLNNDYENVATPARPFDKIVVDSAVSFQAKTTINETDAFIFPVTFPSGRLESISFLTQAFNANTYVSVAIYGSNVDKINGAKLWFSMLDQRIGEDEIIDLSGHTSSSNFVFTNRDGLPAIVKRIGQSPSFTKFTFNWVVLAVRNTVSSGAMRLWGKTFNPGGNENILSAGFAFMPSFGSTGLVITNASNVRQFAETFNTNWPGLTELTAKTIPYIQFNVVK